MRLDNQFTVPVGIDDAWKVLLDVERIAPCMPGASLDSVDGEAFTGRVKVRLGPISMTYRGSARFASLDHERHAAVLEANGKDTRGASTASATVTTSLVEEAGATRVNVQTELNITGRPAQFGRGVLADVSAKLVDQFAECLASRIAFAEVAPAPASAAAATAGDDQPAVEAPPSPAGGEARAPEPPGDGGPASVPAPAPLGAEGDGSAGAPAAPRSPTATLPASAPAVAGAVTAQTTEPAPLDLLQTAGLPVLKRLGPVVAAAVGLVVLLLLLRRRGARDDA